MKFHEWLNTWKGEHPGQKLTPEQADRIFVGMCRLLQEDYDRVGESGYEHGCITADSFDMQDDLPVRFTAQENPQANGCTQYCPGEDDGPRTKQTDMFAMGVILFELLTFRKFCDEIDCDPADFEDVREYYEKEDGSGPKYVKVPTALYADAERFDETFENFTAFDRADRIQDMSELPYCEYAWTAVNVENGQEIMQSGFDCILVAFGAAGHARDVLVADGITWELEEMPEPEFPYSFLKEHPPVQILYRQKDNPEDWAGGDLGLQVREQEGAVCFAVLLPGGREDSEQRLTVTHGMMEEKDYLAAAVYLRKRERTDQVNMERKPSAFRFLREFRFHSGEYRAENRGSEDGRQDENRGDITEIRLPQTGWVYLEIGLKREPDDTVSVVWDLFDEAWNLLASS